ncbi:MAG: tyrosine-type recombinase/integrase [Magnetococcales bacterium]|nr:tyrosine-type recombinase/integrase [Magnetococcales bacterium]
MPLSDAAIRAAKPSDKPFKLTDGDGMYLFVNPSGRYFRMDYRFDGKRKTLALGVYPETGLKDARQKRDEARKLLANGIDPMAQKRAAKAVVEGEDQFEPIARKWLAVMAPSWTPEHLLLVTRRLERDAFPEIGKMPIKTIRTPDVRVLLEKMAVRGVTVSVHRVKQIIGAVFRYAVAGGIADVDPTVALSRTLTPVKETHRAAITDPTEVAGLLRAIEGYRGSIVTKCALRLAPLVFVRPGELRQAEWVEVNLETATWVIPGVKMKMRDPHIVPLSRQAVTVLRELHHLTGGGRYIFPGGRTADRPMSENAVLAALRRMGYEKSEMTGHGFRAMASTLLNEQGWSPDVIERQLAHTERNAVRAAYNRAEHLPERRRMMQAWADYLDGLRADMK